MDPAQITSEDEDLRRYGAKESNLRHIDVTDAVMTRVYNVRTDQISKKYNTRRRTAIIASAFAIILLASVTVQAATGYLEIRNKVGKAVVKVREPLNSLSSPSKSIDQLLKQYREQAHATLQPGGLVAYYINDQAAYNPYDIANPLKYEYLPVDWPTYEDYVQAAEQASAPQLTPTYMPDGFHYKRGNLSPDFPSRGTDKRSQYEDLLVKLTSAAAKTNDKLIMEPVQWSQARSGILTFTNGKTDILLMATKALGVTLYQDKQAIAEKVNVGRQEAIYMDGRSVSNTKYSRFSNRIDWYDESSGVVYNISDDEDSPLTKEEFLKIAKGIISSK